MAALVPDKKIDNFLSSKKVFQSTETIKLIIRDQYRHVVVMAPQFFRFLTSSAMSWAACWFFLVRKGVDILLGTDLATENSFEVYCENWAVRA